MASENFNEQLVKKLQQSFEQLIDYKIKMGEPIVISNYDGDSIVVSAKVAKAIYESRKDELLEIVRHTDDEKLRNYIIGRVPVDEWTQMLNPDEFDKFITKRHGSIKGEKF